MNNKSLWIAVLVIAVILMFITGFWVVEETLKLILYIVLALLAIWAVVNLLRKAKDVGHNAGHGTHV